MKKGILVHQCFSVDMGEPLPPRRRPRRRKKEPKYQGPLCRCREEIDLETAQEWVDDGLAQWIDKTQIGVAGRTKRTPRGATIEKAHMERAYLFGGDEDEAARIEEYGILTLLARVQIGRNFVTLKPEPDGRYTDYGRPILYMPEDNRTPGGHN